MKNRLFLLILPLTIIIYLVLRSTSNTEALLYDANTYYNRAISYDDSGVLHVLLSEKLSFIDSGYPLILSLGMKLFGQSNILFLQILNYLFWGISSFLIYLSLKKVNSQNPKIIALFMLFSPLFMTFSAKIYSEPYAALGVSLLTFAIVSLIQKEQFVGNLALALGAFILFSTKSIFILFTLVIFGILFINQRWIGVFYLIITLVMLFPFLISTTQGGRSIYNLAIQSSKIEHSYDKVFACFPYYLSYPLGKALLPDYEAVCRHNDPNPEMEGYVDNPYVMASVKREDGFSYLEWFKLVITHPIKYISIVLVSTANIVFFEGVYPTVLTKLPMILMLPFFVICKIILSLYLWSRTIVVAKSANIWWLSPLIYFILVVGNFPIESRYFYPLIPYMYFLAGFSYSRV